MGYLDWQSEGDLLSYLELVHVGAVLGAVLVVACGGSATETGAASGGSGGLVSGVAGDTASGGSSGRGSSLGGTGSGGAGQPNGGASSGGSCAPIVACGGNLVGTWQVANLCSGALMSTPNAGCPGASTEINLVSTSGTFTFNADNTTQNNALITFNESAHYPSSCYTAAQCTELQSLLASAANVTSANCGYDAVTGCDCTLMVESVPTSTIGTYQTAGSTLTLQSSTQDAPETDTYCVQGSTLHIQNVDAQSGAISTLTLTLGGLK